MGKQTFNSKTFRVTAPNGVTNRIWFEDFGGNSGVIGGKAKKVTISTPDSVNSAQIAENLLVGSIGTDFATVSDTEEKVRHNMICLAYEGIGANVILEITAEW